MKWNIRKEGIDNYFLEYKDKMIPFHSNVGAVNDLQSVYKNARQKMVMELAKEGKTVKDLIVEVEKNGKIIQDHSNRDFIEESYIKEEQAIRLAKIVKNTLGLTYQELILDMGLNTEEEVSEFFTELGNCLVGRTPSRREQ